MTAPRTRRSRAVRALVAVVATLALTWIAGEVTLRWLLFGEGARARQLGARLRRPALFVHDTDADDHWKLQALFARDRASAPPIPDSELGWIDAIDPVTCAHPDEPALSDRRPVLLFGDSFARCETAPEDCWQGLLERSDLGGDLALLNYGVPGYGLDQIALLLERALPRFAKRDPIVIVGVFVDDDLARCALSFRGWPKPRFRLEDGALVLDAPGTSSVQAWLAQHPPFVGSYFARLVGASVGLRVGSADDMSTAQLRAVCRAILERIAATLAAQDVKHAFLVLFHGADALAHSERSRWQEQLVLEFCRERGIACTSTRPFFDAVAGVAAVSRDDLFMGRETTHAGHYDEAGNRIAFEAILQGLRRADAVAGIARASEWARTGALTPRRDAGRVFRLLGRAGVVRARADVDCVRVYEAPPAPVRWSLRAGDDGRAELRVDLRGATRLTARARATAPPGNECPGGPLVLAVRGPDGAWARREFRLGANEEELVLEGLGGRALELQVERASGNPRCAWLVLEDVRFE